MTTEEQRQHEKLVAIGTELDDLYFSGRLDFDGFQALFHRALAVCGPDDDSVEMFCHFARGAGWWEWMMQELQKAASRCVA
jgi:arabinogalactan endo-1,4-beta-galactosidase